MKKLSKKTLRKKLIFFTISLFFINSILLPISGKQTTIYGKDEDYIIFDQDAGSYDLLVITPNKFSNSLQPLVNHKNKYGVKTKIVETEEVYQQIFWKGKDNAEKIKYFIKESIEAWNISYVLLVGGRKDQSKTESWWVPVRYSNLIRKYGSHLEKKFLSDLYFADIYDEYGNFSSWDTNNNGIYGEWLENETAVDIPNLYPDVSLGCLPCRNIIDVKIAVNKIISYETGDFSDDWFKNMVVVAGDTYPNKTPGFNDGEAHTQKALDNMADFNAVKKWVSDGSLNNWFDIVKAINKGCGFVFFSGHGAPHSWSTYQPGNSDEWAVYFQLRHIPFLINAKKLPVCVSASGCFNNMFNVSLGKSASVYNHPFGIPVSFNIPRCWGESLTLKPFGGCISVIASTAISYESSDIDSKKGGCEWLDINFFEQYGINKVDILGEIWRGTVTAFLQNFTVNWNDTNDAGDALIVKNVEQWLLIGDPSLKIGGYN